MSIFESIASSLGPVVRMLFKHSVGQAAEITSSKVWLGGMIKDFRQFRDSEFSVENSRYDCDTRRASRPKHPYLQQPARCQENSRTPEGSCLRVT